uniref:Photosystem II protein PsbP n=2 Tax=Eukaryota TaxID=2759 RepID=Q7XYI5_BIGNA|nr:photosystem II protein PsbP [Bigelowiella natans]|mmetsp:Transcript_13969/g.22289  ORF Transcript_13969/g.22289 Transcript_13969/m.22289 type:complete len:289 (+) Transcript_13969:40-906(+)|eukprot:jgi/Bigna1/55239/estExt_Genewise1Plus.C_540066
MYASLGQPSLSSSSKKDWKLTASLALNAGLFAGLCFLGFQGGDLSTGIARTRAVAPPMVAPRTAGCRNVRVGAESRRGAMAGIGTFAAAGLFGQLNKASAEYGDPANVFGKVTNSKGFIPTKRDEYSFLLPSKWLYSTERDFDNIVERYQDNFDAVNFAAIIKKKVDGKTSVDQLGSPEEFLKSCDFLFGKQAWTGETKSEGGFKPGSVSALSLLDIDERTDKKGTKYYNYELLSRTADGDEGGRHKLVSAAVKNGQLYIVFIQVGDKRWFKGTDKEALGLRDSFTLA